MPASLASSGISDAATSPVSSDHARGCEQRRSTLGRSRVCSRTSSSIILRSSRWAGTAMAMLDSWGMSSTRPWGSRPATSRSALVTSSHPSARSDSPVCAAGVFSGAFPPLITIASLAYDGNISGESSTPAVSADSLSTSMYGAITSGAPPCAATVLHCTSRALSDSGRMAFPVTITGEPLCISNTARATPPGSSNLSNPTAAPASISVK